MSKTIYNMNKMRKLSPIDIIERAKHDNLWDDGSGFDGKSAFHENSKGQLFHEWVREIQSKFGTEVGDGEDYLRKKTRN